MVQYPIRLDQSAVPRRSPVQRAEPRGGWAIAHFLLVCADEVWGHRARDVLRAEGFDVEIDVDGVNLLARTSADQVDVVGIDLSFPDGLGVTLCGLLRSSTAVAVFAVGPKASEETIVAALAAGADTCIAKEASPRELVARVRALLRKFPPSPGHPDPHGE